MNNEKFVYELKNQLKNELDITYFDTCNSTNLLLKDKAREGAREGTLIIANKQTDGRGRLLKSFYSPKDTGLYMSLLLKPDTKASKTLEITTLASVALRRTASNYTKKSVGIKWVNDIYLDCKKLAGILCEGQINSEGKLDFVAVGIGVNLFSPNGGFPDDIKDIATALFDTAPDTELKVRFTAELLNTFFEIYKNYDKQKILSEYRRYSLICGKNICFLNNGTETAARALSIEDDYSLKIKLASGEILTLNSGDVSIKTML